MKDQLRLNKGNFDHFMKISLDIKSHIQWWIDNLPNALKTVANISLQLVLHTDASLKGWGAFNKSSGCKTEGQWSMEEQNLHINILELKACQLALLSFCKDLKNTYVRVYMDNTTSVAYINKFGGKSAELDTLAREIWLWCLDKSIHVSAAHLPGISNQEADELSRVFNDDLEWSLAPCIFEQLLSHFPDMKVDLFASRLNYKLDNYVSRRPEPHAYAVDAFTVVWNNLSYYIFAPFSLMAKILQKNGTGFNRGSGHCTNLANTGTVGISATNGERAMSVVAQTAGHSQSTTQTRAATPINQDALRSFSLIRKALQRQGVPREAQDVITTSWRQSTKRQFYCYIQQCVLFCGRNKNPRPIVNHILAFLTSLHKKGLKYSAFQTARSALNNFIQICGGTDFSSHFLIKKFMQGIFNLKPSLPKYDTVCDVQVVFKYIETLTNLTLLELSGKLCMLFLLITAQRCQTLHLIEIDDVEFKSNCCIVKNYTYS